MIAYRVSPAQYASTAFGGIGAQKYGGRWNTVGRPVVYLASSRALAKLEVLVHTKGSERLRNTKWSVIQVDFDDDLVTEPSILPTGWDALLEEWNRVPGGTVSQRVGDEWLRSNRSVLLKVPSVIEPAEFNFLLNPAHPDKERIRYGTPAELIFDHRLKE